MTFLYRVANLIIDMDQNVNSFDSEIKEIELSLSRVILTQLEKGTITYDQSREIARYILSQIDDIKNSSQLLVFLQSLYQKWNFFESTYGLYKLRMNDEMITGQKLEEVSNQLSKINNN